MVAPFTASLTLRWTWAGGGFDRDQEVAQSSMTLAKFKRQISDESQRREWDSVRTIHSVIPEGKRLTGRLSHWHAVGLLAELLQGEARLQEVWSACPGFSTEAVQTLARVNVTCVTPLGEEAASIS